VQTICFGQACISGCLTYNLTIMTNYRIVSEGLYIINPEGSRLPGLRQTHVWDGDHYPSLGELKEISATQADVETQAKHDRLASGDEAEKAIEHLLGERYYIPSHWPLLVQKQRVGKVLGYKTLGTVRTSDLLVENEDDFQLQPYWRHIKTKREKTPELKALDLKMIKIGLGAAAVGSAEVYFMIKGGK
jgi:hypothetical protein